MRKFTKIFSVFVAIELLFCSTILIACAENGSNLATSKVEATIVGIDNTLSRNTAYAVARASTDIKDDNHFGKKDVEVWGISETWLEKWVSDTENGIPDWTLTAYCQLSVWDKDNQWQYVTSPSAYSYDQTSTTAQTKQVHTRDGGNASATGTHSIKDYYGNVTWTSETKATERF